MATLANAVELQLKSVLIASDFSAASDKPLRHALAIARRYGSKFCLAHVISSLGLTIAGPEAISLAEQAVQRDADRLNEDLAARGAFRGLEHKTIIRQGEVWPQLREMIREERVDMIVIGTHGRHGIGKLLLGSVAEQIFRDADCLVLTVGPGSYQEARVDNTGANRTLLFTTDFADASAKALPYAISAANRLGAKLVLLHVLPPVPVPDGFHWYTAGDLMQMRQNARQEHLRRLEDLVQGVILKIKPEFVVEFGSASPLSEIVLEIAEKLKVDGIIMGLHRSTHVGAASHMPWSTAYEVVCGASCPVLTVRS
jgi:nucleotide-binding universal stress UspA family protein